MPRGPRPPTPSSQELAKAFLEARTELRRASRILHDDVGSLLAVAGLRLQLLRMDFPESSERCGEVAVALESVMEQVRRLSRELDPMPGSRTSLQSALTDLAQRFQEEFAGKIVLRFTASASLRSEIAGALYEAAALSLAASVKQPGATRIGISASGAKGVTIRISTDGAPKRRDSSFQLAALLARQAGLVYEAATGKGTIVSIRYADRRPVSG